MIQMSNKIKNQYFSNFKNIHRQQIAKYVWHTYFFWHIFNVYCSYFYSYTCFSSKKKKPKKTHNRCGKIGETICRFQLETNVLFFIMKKSYHWRQINSIWTSIIQIIEMDGYASTDESKYLDIYINFLSRDICPLPSISIIWNHLSIFPSFRCPMKCECLRWYHF